MPRKGHRKAVPGDLDDPEGMLVWMRRYVEHLKVKGFSPRTIKTTESCLGLFVEWTYDRGLSKPTEITKPIIESYQKWLFYYRQPSGKPLTFAAQRQRLSKVQGLFKWLARQNVILGNPAADIELPKIAKRLPKAVFSETEVERVLSIPDLTEPLGLRDRAIMETFYSTGIRRFELANLQVFDLDAERGTLTVRLGKGNKDRVVPIGERALHWVGRYTDEVRPNLVVPPDEGTLFLSETGEPLKLPRLTQMTRRYIERAKLPGNKMGACHAFRHTMATLLLEGGADIAFIGAMLGHSQLSSTQVYTRISIRHLKAVHDRAHPGAKLDQPRHPEPEAAPKLTKEDLFKALDQEAQEEDDDS